ncbi:MAG: LacI family transcriptional regulator [Pelolinea sp.]|jgi:LacI family transcriptional regulator|nr:LacI family transcriptional regulator [Pelolinea sp.]
MNINDIAKKAGVSRTTISRVLNNRSDVDEKTREKVLKIINEAGYVANSVARNLRNKSTHKIGLLLYAYVSGVHISELHIASEYYFEIIRGITYEAERADYNIILYSSLYSEGTLDNLDKICKSGEVDGLILVGTGKMKPVIERLKQNAIPFVVANRLIHNSDVNYVGPDDEEGAYLATKHLIDMDHKRIAYISRPSDEETNTYRLEGYKRALKEAKIPYDDTLIAAASYEWGSGEQAMRALLKGENFPSAVFAFNDLLAMEAMRVCGTMGIEIPENMAIIGFDDIHSAAVSHPSLSTIKQPLFEIGAKAMEIVLALVKNEKLPPQQVVVPLAVIERESTAKK